MITEPKIGMKVRLCEKCDCSSYDAKGAVGVIAEIDQEDMAYATKNNKSTVMPLLINFGELTPYSMWHRISCVEEVMSE